MTETVNPSRWTIDRWDDRVAGRALTWAFVGMIALVLIVTAFLVWDSLQSTIRTFQDRQSRMATVLAQQASRDFRGIDMAMSEIIDHISANNVDGGFANVANDDVLRSLVHRILVHLPQIEALALRMRPLRKRYSTWLRPSAARHLSAARS
jgi:type IV secretory pathway TrbF-like protein